MKAKLRVRHVRNRLSNGTTIPYVEGWHVIAEANRIFGYDCWDRKSAGRSVLRRARASEEHKTCGTRPPRLQSRSSSATAFAPLPTARNVAPWPCSPPANNLILIRVLVAARTQPISGRQLAKPIGNRVEDQ